MHELSIVEGLLQHIEKLRTTNEFSQVKKIEIVCGKYNCISEEHLQFWFSISAKETNAAQAQISIRHLGDYYFCAQCHKEFPALGTEKTPCPECGGSNLIGGMDNSIYISKLEVD
jgi:hydrogenase nickel insertion protein HypA